MTGVAFSLSRDYLGCLVGYNVWDGAETGSTPSAFSRVDSIRQNTEVVSQP